MMCSVTIYEALPLCARVTELRRKGSETWFLSSKHDECERTLRPSQAHIHSPPSASPAHLDTETVKVGALYFVTETAICLSNLQ